MGLESLELFKNFDRKNPKHNPLLQAVATLPSSPARKSESDFFPDRINGIPFSLFDLRQTVRYSIDLIADPSAMKALLDHETAFHRHHPTAPTPSRSPEEYAKAWTQFSSVQLVIRRPLDGPQDIHLSLAPSMAVVDTFTINRVIQFFKLPSASDTLEKVRQSPPKDINQQLINYWRESPPLSLSTLGSETRAGGLKNGQN